MFLRAHPGKMDVPDGTQTPTSFCSVPVVDFSAYGLHVDTPDEEKLQELSKELHQKLVTVGFVHLTNVGISPEIIQKSFQVSQDFFSLSAVKKAKYKSDEWIKDSFHGYVSTDMEGLNTDTEHGRKDFKESFNIRPEIKETASKEFPEIPEVPEMKSTLVDLFRQCQRLHQRVLEIMAKGLGLKDTMALANKCHLIGTTRNCTTLRTLHYPALGASADINRHNAIRCGEHSDYGAITLLFQDSTGGLEVLNVNGDWMPIHYIPDTVLINVGDLMQRLTSDVYKAARHRVVFPPNAGNRSRQSIAFFGNPNDEAVIECIDGSGKYPPVNSLEYIFGRAKESHSVNGTHKE